MTVDDQRRDADERIGRATAALVWAGLSLGAMLLGLVLLLLADGAGYEAGHYFGFTAMVILGFAMLQMPLAILGCLVMGLGALKGSVRAQTRGQIALGLLVPMVLIFVYLWWNFGASF